MRAWLAEALSSPQTSTPEALLYQARTYDNATLHDMRDLPGVTAFAAEHDLYTSTEPRRPGTFWEFRRRRNLQRALGTIAARVEARFQDDEMFAEAVASDTLPWALASVFDSVIRIHGEGAHLVNPRTVDGRPDGDVVIGQTIIEVEPGCNEMVAHVLRKLLHKADVMPPSVATVDDHEGQSGLVIVGGKGRKDVVSEHDIRAVGRALDASIEHWLLARGIYLPRTKRSYTDWLAEGRTFTPLEADHMRHVHERYLCTPNTGTYIGRPDLEPIQRLRPLGHDASGFFQRWRDIVNGLGWDLRGGSSAHNLEQDPNPKTRISLEEGIVLRRAEITREQAAKGPGSARTLTGAEAAQASLTEIATEARQHKFSASVRLVKLIKSATDVIDITLEGIGKLPTAHRQVQIFTSDITAYRLQKAASEQAGKALDALAWKAIMGPRFRDLDHARQHTESITPGP